MEYIPTEIDIQWSKAMLSVINDGGILMYPRFNMQYRFDHLHHRMTLLNGENLSAEQFTVHCQTKIVFAQAGYEVDIEKEQAR